MKKFLAFAVVLASAPAQADISHKIQSSVQLTVDGAASAATRVPTVYSVTGSGASTTDGTTTGALGGFGAVTNGVPAVTTISATQATSGSAFSFSSSYIEGDSTSATGSTVTSGVVGSLPLFGDTTTTSGGVAGSLAGTIDSQHAVTITAGGAGTTATGQMVTELTIR
jgi:hypothetical protein